MGTANCHGFFAALYQSIQLGDGELDVGEGFVRAEVDDACIDPLGDLVRGMQHGVG